MNGLRRYERDRLLPALAGQPELCLPSELGVEGAIRDYLVRDDSVRVERASLDYARWKPGSSVTGGYSVELGDGERRFVTLKIYAEGKAGHIARRLEQDSSRSETEDDLRPFAVIEDEGLCLWSFPADRVLRGLERLHDPRRLRRVLASADLIEEPYVVQRRPSRLELLRYKPEHRAVLRFEARLRGKGDDRARKVFAVRALDPDSAAVVVARRRRCPFQLEGGSSPRLLHADVENGILIEEWLAGESQGYDSFDHADAAGRVLAELHRTAIPVSVIDPPGATALDALFRVDKGLGAVLAECGWPDAGVASAWVHGDFHPDQVLLDPDGEPKLLDLDALRPGDPLEDLASWITDRLAVEPGLDPADAAAPLLEGYRAAGGAEPSVPALLAHVRSQLVQRAAGCIRRLERDAVQSARRLIERARDLASASPGLR